MVDFLVETKIECIQAKEFNGYFTEKHDKEPEHNKININSGNTQDQLWPKHCTYDFAEAATIFNRPNVIKKISATELTMEEKISGAESRGAAPGLLLQSFLNALQQRGSKTSQISQPAEGSAPSESSISYSNSQSNTSEKVDVDLDDVDSWKSSLSSTRKKINETWVQYSPTFRDKVQKYSPNPLKKLKTLFTLPEEKDADPDAGGMNDDKRVDDASYTEGHDSDGMANPEGVGILNHGSSQTEKVPSEMTITLGKDESPTTIPQSNEVKDQNPPSIILEEADSGGNGIKNADIHSERVHLRKSPLTVQEWVDHLPVKPKINEKDCDDSLGSKDLDNLATDALPSEEKKSLIAQKLSREASVQSSSSLDSILDSRRPDPVEVLLNLGFGGVPGVDLYNCRIPKRFLVPSKCKGGDWNEFLKRELLQAQNFECASLGFRGLSGPSYRRPSAIVANIMEKLREKATPHHPVKSRFSIVAKRILNEKSVLNKLVPPSQSVLSPDSRKFLDNQGKISPEVPRRRIIFGQKSFRFGNDGEFIEVESSKKTLQKESPASVDSSSADSECDENKTNPGTLPRPDIMLKIRRSSLQRQKKVEEESESCDMELSTENGCTASKENYHGEEHYSKGDKKIPMRFVSSSNLWQPISDGNSKTPEEIKLEVAEEIRTLTEKIQNASSVELSSVLLQMKELRTRLENSCGHLNNE